MYRILLRNFRQRCKAAEDVSAWQDVESLLLRGSRDDPGKDQILLTILIAHKEDERPEWRSVLLLLFWHDLEWIWRFLAHLDAEEFSRWTNVLWAFSETICNFDPTQRRERVIQKIRNDTIHRVKDAYASEIFRTGLFDSLDEQEEEDQAPRPDPAASVDPGWTEMEQRLESEAILRLLESFAARGIIAERDLPLLKGTIIYGQTIVDWASAKGVPRERIKKRRQRVMARIRRHFKDLEEM